MSICLIGYSTNMKNQGDLKCCVIYVDVIFADVEEIAAAIIIAAAGIITEQEAETPVTVEITMETAVRGGAVPAAAIATAAAAAITMG